MHEQQTIPGHLQRQIEFCEAVMKALGNHERKFHRNRACKFFSINPDFYNSNDNNEDQITLSQSTRTLFQTLATQAFQLGYVMAIFTVVEELKREQSTTSPFLYPQRLKLIEFVTDVYLTALNEYFSPSEKTVHRTLSGYIQEPRASVFDANAHGLRGLLAMSVNELNERQWRFFRYAVLEIVHSRFCWDAAREKMKNKNNAWTLEWYRAAIPRLVDGIISERKKYTRDAVEAAVKGREFESLRMRKESEAKGGGKTPEQIQQIVEELETTRKSEAKENALNHLKASLKKVEKKEEMVNRLKDGLE